MSSKKLLIVALVLITIGLVYYYCSKHVHVNYEPASTNYHSTF